jgi:hypothetical protein
MSISTDEKISRIITIRKRILSLIQELNKSGICLEAGDLMCSSENQLEDILLRDQSVMNALTEMVHEVEKSNQ